MSKKYIQRVGLLLRRKITQLLLAGSNDPRLGIVTITDVIPNRDTTRAEVFYSLYGTDLDRREIHAVLTGMTGWLRSEMAATLRLRKIPELVFVYDPSLEHGARIEAILGQLDLGADEPDASVEDLGEDDEHFDADA